MDAMSGRTLVDLDFENRLPAVVPTIGAHAMRYLGVTTVRAIVDRHTLGFVVGATLPLALFRGPLFWNRHYRLTCS